MSTEKRKLEDILESTENPMEQMFLESLQIQLEIGRNPEAEVKDRIKALDEFQRAYLSYTMTDTMKETVKEAGRASRQARRLKDDE